jgi:bifunctional non-homologous end joining protein LigD
MAKALDPYRGKRDFSRTPEPAGGGAGGGFRFVVHKHHATADHYDLRLELDGVLKSWAVPKGPSLDPADKRLAVQTEDHPVEYIDFEAVIPEGEYGGGPMIVWDTGTWAPMGDPARDIAAGAFKFRLAGQKLGGGWMLARLKPRKPSDKPAWLFFKEHDIAARPGSDILDERPESVKTGRRIEELGAAPAPPPAASPRAAALQPGRLKGAVKGPLPEIAPMLASPAAEPPSGAGWLHEIKLDGYRTLARLDGRAVRLTTRAGLDWTHRYGDLPAAFTALPCRDAVIDGEIVVLDGDGVSRFALLQEALSAGDGHRLVFFAFDLVHLNGWNLAAVPLVDRKRMLERLVGAQPARSGLVYLDHVTGDGQQFWEKVSEMGLEGVVSKRDSSGYQPGTRARTWLKSKAVQVGDFPIAGFTTSKAAGGLAALALGEWHGDELHFVGKVGTGFDAATAAALLERLEPLTDGGVALAGGAKDIRWVRPVLTAHVHYASRTGTNAIRHGVFKGLREVALTPGAAPRRTRLVSDADLAGVWVTNPTRRLFGKAGPVKLDVAVYYAQVGDFMLPHLFERPVSLFRCPSGRPQDCFFQRHPFVGQPEGIARVETRDSDGESKTYVSVTDVKSYLALAQFGVIEFHTWGCLRDDLEHPDRITFDLDPGEDVPWRETVEAAVHVRSELQALGLEPFVKTTGGKGLHVLCPIVPRLDWKAVHAVTGAIAARIEKGAPQVFVTNMAKARRGGRIFIDFHRNARGASAVAPYSLRARTNLPVSTPIGWSDLETVDAPGNLNYSTVPGLVSGSGDAWAEIHNSARDLPDTIHAG